MQARIAALQASVEAVQSDVATILESYYWSRLVRLCKQHDCGMIGVESGTNECRFIMRNPDQRIEDGICVSMLYFTGPEDRP